MSYYLETYGDLRSAVSERRANRKIIRQNIDDWAMKCYGLPNFTIISDEFFGLRACPEDVSPTLLLARQLASMNVEEAACRLLAKSMRHKFVLCSFKADSFCSQNHDKRQRVKIPWLSWSKKGNPVVYKEYVAKLPMEKLEGVALDQITTAKDLNLAEYHRQLGRQVFGNEATVFDVSREHERNLRQATRRPGSCFAIDETGYARKMTTEDALVSSQIVRLRPPASWYYPLYLTWFLDGTLVLLETYENPAGGVPEAKKLFVRTMDYVSSQTGYFPLILRIPPLTDDLLFCNTHLLAAGAWAELCEALPCPNETDVINDLAYGFARKVIEYRGG